MTELVILLAVLALATAFGLWRRRRDGVVRPVRTAPPWSVAPRSAVSPDSTASSSGMGSSSSTGSSNDAGRATGSTELRLDPADLGRELGRRATLVQFSTAFCQPCRANRGTLAHVAATDDGVAHVEIDAEKNLDLVRRLGIVRTPTVLIVDAHGQVVGRATGALRMRDVRAALPAAD